MENDFEIDIIAGNEFRRFNDFDFERRDCERNDRRECGFFERRECRRNGERRNCCRSGQGDPPREEDFRRNGRGRDANFVIVNVFNGCRRGRRERDEE